MAGNTLPERVAQIYYTYGLFCSSYPFAAIFFSLSVVMLCCYPLLNVPLPGNNPSVVKLPLDFNICSSYDKAAKPDCESNCIKTGCRLIDLDTIINETQKLPYLWVKDKPIFYIQQIILKSGVSPWNNKMKMWDAFRGPLQEVFRLLETVRNHEDPEMKTTLSSHCFQVDGFKRKDKKPNMEQVLPEYSCLLLSPANLWNTNIQTFSLDSNIINTILNYQYLPKGKVSVAEMAFGMQLRDTGIKRYPLRARSRTIQYALTIFYQHFDERYINSLNAKLRNMYPLHQDVLYTHTDEVTLIYYPGDFNICELIPLTVTFFGIFLYVYFSVRKIEFIKSKLGLAACAVLTVAGSLSMSLGICFYFGFSLSLQGKEIFPYLLIIVGLENVLVLTKSVTSTDSRLDVKIRLAQGLSKEGWSITKNLLTEMTILTVSFFTFVPFIQEFSIFMIISLLSDYFIQMVFFATILGIDVHRMECFQDQNNKSQLKEYFNSYSVLNWRYNRKYSDETESPQRMIKSRSHPRLNGLSQIVPTNVVAKRNSIPKQLDKVPKRIRLVNLWARTRFFQRAFMVWMLVWISMIVYNSGLIEYFITSTGKSDPKTDPPVARSFEAKTAKPSLYDFYSKTHNNSLTFSPLLEVSNDVANTGTNDTIFLKHIPHMRPWTRLSPYYWSSIVSQYNESLGGKYVVILPPTLLSHRVSPELAVGLRNPEERDPQPLRWQALVAALDPIDILPEFDIDSKVPSHQWSKAASDIPIYPTTPMEILLLAILCTISVIVIAYMMVVLYRCICSRNYAEWRASWTEKEEYLKILSKQPAVQLVMEAVPLVVTGHSQEVECLVTDGEKVVSTCLQGDIKVWDSQNGEMLLKIDRKTYFKHQKELQEKLVCLSGGFNELAEVTKVPDSKSKTNEGIQRLRMGLSNHLTGLQFRSLNSNDLDLKLSAVENTKYQFAKSYRDLYCSEPRSDEELNCYEVKEKNEISDKTNLNHDISYSDKDTNSVFKCNNKPSLRHRSRHSFDRNNSVVSKKDIEHLSQLNCRNSVKEESPIWCMDFYNDLIILGCADGRLEFWDGISGKLVCIWWCSKGDRSAQGVSHVRALCGGRRVCAATLSGHLSLIRLDAFNVNAGVHVDWQFSTAHRRTHKRTGSAGSIHTHYNPESPREQGNRHFTYEPELSDSEEVQCTRLAYCRPHQQPISEMHCEGGRILTGGQDHVLKVFSSSDLSPLFTLHGHCGPITSCFIDHATPTIGGSGSQDGLLCVWDLHTGACLYSMQAHDGAVTSLAYTASYVVSAGADERLCVWDRFQGHMLNSLHIGLNYMSKMLPLTHTLLLMGERNGLTVYDLSSGDVIRRVLLGQNDGCIFVRQLLPLKDAIVCDYANQLRIVRFPLVSKLSDMKSD